MRITRGAKASQNEEAKPVAATRGKKVKQEAEEPAPAPAPKAPARAKRGAKAEPKEEEEDKKGIVKKEEDEEMEDQEEGEQPAAAPAGRGRRAAAAPKAAKKAAPAPKKAPAAKKAAPASKAKRGLKGHAAPDSRAPLGVVDPASGLKGSILNTDDGTVYDVMLSKVDVAANEDKYFLLQVVVMDAGGYSTYSRWGRTGTSGQCQDQRFDIEEDAVQAFADKYKEKTGCEWEDREDYVPLAGHYKALKTDHAAIAAKSAAIWQYYVDDGVDGKATDWYDYDQAASDIVERLHDEYMYNRELAQRCVQSGYWNYLVDLAKGTQENTATHKIRRIRRKLLNFNGGGNAAAAPATPPNKKQKVAGGAAKAAKAVAAPSAAPPPAPVKVKAQPAAGGSGQKMLGSGKVDPMIKLPGASVVDDYDVMLNQTDIKNNNNKFYRIQLVQSGGQYYCFTRWGRVGEEQRHTNKLEGPQTLQGAEKDFIKKFSDKTGNKWDARFDFVKKEGKYDVLELDADAAIVKDEPMEEDEDEEGGQRGGKGVVQVKTMAQNTAPCTLDAPTQELVQFIFDEDMFKSQMVALELDLSKMPLGALSKAQVQKGSEVLEEIETHLKSGGGGFSKADQDKLVKLCNRFYTVIPHSFGRRAPPVIDTLEAVQAKYDLCNTLGDIEAAQEMAEAAKKMPSSASAVHPIDAKYRELQAELALVKPGSTEHSMVATYLQNTMDTYHQKASRVQHVWRVDRNSDDARFAAHAGIDHRKLLWHGTNAAVVAAILKSGLRIMPHSGGRVGRGIYLASEAGKSVWYVRSAKSPSGKQLGVLFLVEAALGSEASITRDDPSLKAAPQGHDSVVARGQSEPDPSKDTTIPSVVKGKTVIVPQGKPVKQAQYNGSSFQQSEYLLYKESQHRLRYVITVEM